MPTKNHIKRLHAEILQHDSQRNFLHTILAALKLVICEISPNVPRDQAIKEQEREEERAKQPRRGRQ